MRLLASQTLLQRVRGALLDYGRHAVEAVPSLLMAALVLIAFLFIAGIARKIAERSASRLTESRSLENLFGTVARAGTLVIGVFCALSVLFPGLSAGHLVSVLGLSSVAIGFAFKNIFENFLAGVLILIQRPFRIDDQVIVDGYEGTVEEISIRSTQLKTYDGERIILPNSKVYSSPIQVRTAYDARRTTFHTGIGYDEDVGTARDVIAETLESCESILDEPAPQVLVSEHGDSSVNFEVRFWTESRSGNIVAARDEVATKVKKALDEAGIEIPYPYRTIEFFDMSSERNAEAA